MNLNKGRRTFQLSAKGSLVVRDCTDDGKCLTVENTGTKVLSLCHIREHYVLGVYGRWTDDKRLDNPPRGGFLWSKTRFGELGLSKSVHVPSLTLLVDDRNGIRPTESWVLVC